MHTYKNAHTRAHPNASRMQSCHTWHWSDEITRKDSHCTEMHTQTICSWNGRSEAECSLLLTSYFPSSKCLYFTFYENTEANGASWWNTHSAHTGFKLREEARSVYIPAGRIWTSLFDLESRKYELETQKGDCGIFTRAVFPCNCQAPPSQRLTYQRIN